MPFIKRPGDLRQIEPSDMPRWKECTGHHRMSYHEHATEPHPLPAGSLDRHQAMTLDAEEIARRRKHAFPSLDEAARRIRHRRERAVAQCFALTALTGAAFAAGGHFTFDALMIGSIITSLGGLGFVATCFISGHRSRRDNGGHGAAQ